jgi:excisionase family DNA binding protein
MTDRQLLMPVREAARRMGISRWTLNRRIEARDIRAVKFGSRRFIPQSEIDRLLSGAPSAQISATKPARTNEISGDGANGSTGLQGNELSIAEIMALPIHSEERWKLLTASKWPRNDEFFHAMMELVEETDHEAYEARTKREAPCPKTLPNEML